MATGFCPRNLVSGVPPTTTRARLRLRAAAPLEGLTNAGWRLALTSDPSSMHLAHEADDKDLDLR